MRSEGDRMGERTHKKLLILDIFALFWGTDGQRRWYGLKLSLFGE